MLQGRSSDDWTGAVVSGDWNFMLLEVEGGGKNCAALHKTHQDTS